MAAKKTKLNWGIVGLGNIAHQFAQDLLMVEDASLTAVASRTKVKAESFAKKYDAKIALANYTELFNHPEIDIVYIATPHNSHKELAIEAMVAGKHILCEKPLAVNQVQAEAMIKTAQNTGVFFMEAFWSRFNPSIQEIFTRIQNGDIGTVNYINADFTFYRNDSDDSRMLNPSLAGGSLLDMGVYPVFLAYLILGKPQLIHAVGHLHHTGVDLQTAATFQYRGALAQMMSGFLSQSDMKARICGTKGSIFIDPIWHETQAYTFFDNHTRTTQKINLPTKGKGFTYEIEECIQCIQRGEQQSKLWSWQNSLDLLSITDEIRRQINLKYPFE